MTIHLNPCKGIHASVDYTPEENPVIPSAANALKRTSLVQINEAVVQNVASHIHERMLSEHYTPRTWRDHPLHICPQEPYNPSDPHTARVLDWIFLISCLNFSFWSEKEGTSQRFGIEWRESWCSEKRKVWTGYWSLVAALNRALDEDLFPITSPAFYASEEACPDSLIEYIFRPARQSTEPVPLLKERIAVMREVGHILVTRFRGSFQGFIEEFHRTYDGRGTALDLVKMVTATFPCFRDEVLIGDRKLYFWKRAQILVAETWAAFYPESSQQTHRYHHPLFPGPKGPMIHQLTMFPDYRVPQILHYLKLLIYSPQLVDTLLQRRPVLHGSPEEIAIRGGSIIAVERVRQAMMKLREKEENEDQVSSVVIDFYLWDMAKRIEEEDGPSDFREFETGKILPIHRTRSIWY